MCVCVCVCTRACARARVGVRGWVWVLYVGMANEGCMPPGDAQRLNCLNTQLHHSCYNVGGTLVVELGLVLGFSSINSWLHATLGGTPMLPPPLFPRVTVLRKIEGACVEAYLLLPLACACTWVMCTSKHVNAHMQKASSFGWGLEICSIPIRSHSFQCIILMNAQKLDSLCLHNTVCGSWAPQRRLGEIIGRTHRKINTRYAHNSLQMNHNKKQLTSASTSRVPRWIVKGEAYLCNSVLHRESIPSDGLRSGSQLCKHTNQWEYGPRNMIGEHPNATCSAGAQTMGKEPRSSEYTPLSHQC